MSIKPVPSELAEVFQSFDAQDVGKIAEFMTEDVQLRVGNAPLISAKAAFVEAVRGFLDLVAGVHHEILHVYADGEVAVVEFDVHYTRRDGRSVVLPCCNVFRLRGGLDLGVPQLHGRHSRVRRGLR
jgi:ketosteroid isomerase-like protein